MKYNYESTFFCWAYTSFVSEISIDLSNMCRIFVIVDT
jgi:hypothetical protein